MLSGVEECSWYGEGRGGSCCCSNNVVSRAYHWRDRREVRVATIRLRFGGLGTRRRIGLQYRKSLANQLARGMLGIRLVSLYLSLSLARVLALLHLAPFNPLVRLLTPARSLGWSSLRGFRFSACLARLQFPRRESSYLAMQRNRMGVGANIVRGPLNPSVFHLSRPREHTNSPFYPGRFPPPSPNPLCVSFVHDTPAAIGQ